MEGKCNMHLSEIWHSKKNDCCLSRTQVIVDAKRIRLKRNPRIDHPIRYHWTDSIVLVPNSRVMATCIPCQCHNSQPRFKWRYLQPKWLRDSFLYLFILDVAVYVCDDAERKYFWNNPCWWIWVRICLFEMDNEFLFWFAKLMVYQIYCLLKLCGADKVSGICYPEGGTCHWTADVDYRTTHSNFNLLKLIKQ